MSMFRCEHCDTVTDGDECDLTTEAFEITGYLVCDECAEDVFAREPTPSDVLSSLQGGM